jgi:hypothetical protein
LGYISKEISLTAICESKVFFKPWMETVGWPRMELFTGSLGIACFFISSSFIRPMGRTVSRSIGETTFQRGKEEVRTRRWRQSGEVEGPGDSHGEAQPSKMAVRRTKGIWVFQS